MPLSRRHLLAAALGLAAGCSVAPAAPRPAVPPADPAALIAWLAANRSHASVFLDDGRGTLVTATADRPRPVASAAKVVHLTAYAQAVAAGRLHPDGRVAVAEWDRWYVPGTDGSAHPNALAALRLGAGDAARWDDVAAVMIDYSDNSAADLLRATLGDAALAAAAAAGGWAPVDLPSYAGQALLAPGPTGSGGVPAGTDRRAAELAAARSWADDPGRRAAAARAAAPSSAAGATAAAPSTDDPAADAAVGPTLRWYSGSAGATATQLASLHRAAATGTLGADVSATVRRHLERVLAHKLPSGVVGAGQKGGSLPGLIANAFTVRRADGSVGVSVLGVSDLAWLPYRQLLASGAVVALSQQALLDDAVRDRLRTAVTGR